MKKRGEIIVVVLVVLLLFAMPVQAVSFGEWFKEFFSEVSFKGATGGAVGGGCYSASYWCTEGWVGDTWCEGTDVRQYYQKFYCVGGLCKNEKYNWRKKACGDVGCSNGACNPGQTPICSYARDCGVDGWYGSNTCKDGNVYQGYRQYYCANPRTMSSKCHTNFDGLSLKQNCQYGCENGRCKSPPKPKCYRDSDCGTTKWTGSPICKNNNVYQSKVVYVCNNKGRTDAYCSSYSGTWQKQDCSYGCVNGICRGQAICSRNSDCGDTRYINSPVCDSNGNVQQLYRTYICRYPGTSSASCSYSDSNKLKQTCQYGCSNGVCDAQPPPVQPPPLTQGVCSKDSDCGTNEWLTKWGMYWGPRCHNGKIYQPHKTYKCNNPGTILASCSSNVDAWALKDDCQWGCISSPLRCISKPACFRDSNCGSVTECRYTSGGFSQVVEKASKCLNAGTESASCQIGVVYPKVKYDCKKSSCDNWVTYCEDGDVYKKKTCHDRGCADAACYDNVKEEKQKVNDCPSGCSNGICKVYINAVNVGGYPLDWCSHVGCGENNARIHCARMGKGTWQSFSKGVGARDEGGTYKYTSTGGYHNSRGDEYFASLKCVGEVKCSKESDCGTDSWVGDVQCYSGRLWQNYRAYTCENAGTANAVCSVKETRHVKTDCRPSGCSGNACKATCATNADCGEEGYIGDVKCFDGNVNQKYRTYTCNNPGTSSSSCTPKEEFKLKESCEAGCSGGKCTVAAA
ncbi:MAG: hypothetical protein U9O94_05370, partial [Nanoarchaeota archaeon]|nr:hypothetical protein [Nanoarchaeota archaeon]